MYYTTGRFGRTSLQSLYGISELPVLDNSTRLALPIMREVHQGCIGANHWKSSPSMAGQSGQYAITYNPHNLGHQVSRNRTQWSLKDAKNNQKTNHDIPKYQTQSPPFRNLSADLARLPGSKYKEERTGFLIYLCNMLKVLHMKPVENYMTGGSQRQVDRMLGSKIEDKKFPEITPRMTEKVNPDLMTIVTSRSSDQESLNKLSDKLLGYLYNRVEAQGLAEGIS